MCDNSSVGLSPALPLHYHPYQDGILRRQPNDRRNRQTACCIVGYAADNGYVLRRRSIIWIQSIITGISISYLIVWYLN